MYRVSLIQSWIIVILVSMVCGCDERQTVLVFSTPEEDKLGYTCAENECDGVGNINGEVDWIEPSQVEDPLLLAATQASGMINIDKGIL